MFWGVRAQGGGVVLTRVAWRDPVEEIVAILGAILERGLAELEAVDVEFLAAGLRVLAGQARGVLSASPRLDTCPGLTAATHDIRAPVDEPGHTLDVEGGLHARRLPHPHLGRELLAGVRAGAGGFGRLAHDAEVRGFHFLLLKVLIYLIRMLGYCM